jgi:hypothetical protein
MKKYNFTCCFVWLWNLISQIKGRIYIVGVWEQCAEENISIQEESKKEDCGKSYNEEGISDLVIITTYSNLTSATDLPISGIHVLYAVSTFVKPGI